MVQRGLLPAAPPCHIWLRQVVVSEGTHLQEGKERERGREKQVTGYCKQTETRQQAQQLERRQPMLVGSCHRRMIGCVVCCTQMDCCCSCQWV